MRRRLLTAMLLVAVVAVAGFGIPLALSVQARYRDEALLILSEEAARAAVAVPGSFVRDNDPPELPVGTRDVRIALYGLDGTRLQGNGPRSADTPVIAALDGSRSRRPSGDQVVAVPISDEEVIVGAIRASIPGAVVARRTRQTWAAMAGLASAVLVAAGLLAAQRSRSLTRPLAELRADADMIGAGGEIGDRNPTGVEEIDAVRSALAAAAGRLNDALARERALGSDLAHQLRTPLAALRLRLETAQLDGRRDDADLRDALSDINRLEQTIDDLLVLARDTHQTREAIAISTLTREALARWQPRIAAKQRTLRGDIGAQLPWVEASPGAIRQILDVLIENAIRHGAGDVVVSARRVGTGAVIAVTDQGIRTLDADEIFVRRHPESVGSGIGLALARRLADAEHLRLLLAHPGPGPAFHLVMPGRTSVTRPSGDATPPGVAPGGGSAPGGLSSRFVD